MRIPAERRLFSSAWAEHGREDVVLWEVLAVADGERLRLTFESASNRWRHGLWVATDQGLTIADQRIRQADLWTDTAPPEVSIVCHTTDGLLHFYNAFEDNGIIKSQTYSSGMLVEDLTSGHRYRCNDVGFDAAFDDLVFRIEREDR